MVEHWLAGQMFFTLCSMVGGGSELEEEKVGREEGDGGEESTGKLLPRAPG